MVLKGKEIYGVFLEQLGDSFESSHSHYSDSSRQVSDSLVSYRETCLINGRVNGVPIIVNYDEDRGLFISVKKGNAGITERLLQVCSTLVNDTKPSFAYSYRKEDTYSSCDCDAIEWPQNYEHRKKELSESVGEYYTHHFPGTGITDLQMSQEALDSHVYGLYIGNLDNFGFCPINRENTFKLTYDIADKLCDRSANLTPQEIEETTYALDYSVRMSRAYIDGISEPQYGKRINPGKQFFKWFNWESFCSARRGNIMPSENGSILIRTRRNKKGKEGERQ